jgi:RNA polymerase sigma factor (sigma-70 family)
MTFLQSDTPHSSSGLETNSSGQNSAAAETGPEAQWTELVEKVKNDETAGMEELYRVFSRGVRFYLCRQLGPQDLDDKVHDTFLIVAQAIRRGDLREPERLMGYVRTVVRRQVAAQIEENVKSRKNQTDLESGLVVADSLSNPEQAVIRRQQHQIAMEVLQSISRRDREILMRFYLGEQSQEKICSEMGLTETQFRLLKSRAKARFGELGKKRLSRHRRTLVW